MSSVILRLHIRSFKPDISHTQVIQDRFPAFPIIKGDKHHIPIILTDGTCSKKTGHCLAAADPTESEGISTVSVNSISTLFSIKTGRGNILITAHYTIPVKGIADDSSAKAVTTVTAVAHFRHIRMLPGICESNIQIFSVKINPVSHISAPF